jgi:hypothetical protein
MVTCSVCRSLHRFKGLHCDPCHLNVFEFADRSSPADSFKTGFAELVAKPFRLTPQKSPDHIAKNAIGALSFLLGAFNHCLRLWRLVPVILAVLPLTLVKHF